MRRLFCTEERMATLQNYEKIFELEQFYLNLVGSDPDYFNYFSKFEIKWYLGGMLLPDIDATSMRWGLEVRVPFLDPKLVSFVVSIPSFLKLQNGHKINKPLLVKTFQDILPSEVIYNGKRGFEMPIGFWLKDDFLMELNVLKDVKWLRKSFVNFLLAKFYKNPRNYLKVWTILVMLFWFRRFNVEVNIGEKKEDLIYSSW